MSHLEMARDSPLEIPDSTATEISFCWSHKVVTNVLQSLNIAFWFVKKVAYAGWVMRLKWDLKGETSRMFAFPSSIRETF